MENRHFNHPILLVEDNPVDIDLTLRAFKIKKLINPIEVARDGEEALALAEKWLAGERHYPTKCVNRKIINYSILTARQK